MQRIMNRMQPTPNLTKNLLKKVIKGKHLSNCSVTQAIEVSSVIIDTDEIIVKTSNFCFSIQCVPENPSKKDLFKNLIKSPV